MREIEIKARVTNKQGLLKTLSDKGVVLSSPIKQHDVVYGIKDAGENSPGSVWLRIRTENDTKTIFTLKKQVQGGLDSLEHETEVADAEEMEAIIHQLGFVLYSDLTKSRQKAKIGEIEICLDEVEEIGVYIEAEKLAKEDADGDEAVKELWEILSDLGIRRADEVFDGYDVLLNRHKAEHAKIVQ